MSETQESISMNIDIEKILKLNKVKESQRQIAKFMKCSRKAIQNILANYLFETFQRYGLWYTYQRKTSQREDQYIEHELKQNSFLPFKDITNKIGLPISESTL